MEIDEQVKRIIIDNLQLTEYGAGEYYQRVELKISGVGLDYLARNIRKAYAKELKKHLELTGKLFD